LVQEKPRNGYSPRAVEKPTPVKSLTLTATTTGRFHGDKFKYIDEEIPATSHLWLVPDDILIQRANTLDYVGVSAVFDGPPKTFIYPDLMMKCRANDRVLTRFLWCALSSESARRYFRDNATGTAGNMPKINQQTVLRTPVRLPPKDEQEEICRRVEVLFASADSVDLRHRNALKAVEGLYGALLAKAFRGNLALQDPGDEPAANLLDGLRTRRVAAAAEPQRRRRKDTGKKPMMRSTPKDAIKVAILRLKVSIFSFDELRAQVTGDYDSVKDALFELLEERKPVVRQVFDEEAKTMQFERVTP
jgi:type I restriction enzyme S subunit